MARRRKGEPVHGWIVLDKPPGLTANQALGRVKRIFNPQKAGHAGTLDPLASGVLPIALGEATKTVAFAMDGAKTYRFAVRWGVATDTDDAEGAEIARSDVRPRESDIAAILPEFTGEILQRPPVYSALKVAGRRSYDLARAGTPPELAPRPVRIDSLRFLCMTGDEAEFEVRCGKGTYVRSLARDIAERLGTLGHIVALRRTAVGPFREEDSFSLDKLESFGHSPAAVGRLPACLLPVETALDDIPALALTESEADRLRNGQPVPVLRTANRERIASLADDDMVSALLNGRLVALARLEGRQVFPVRVFNIQNETE